MNLATQCPACAGSFTPWGVWRVTRWSCMTCPLCGVKLNRALTLKTWAAWIAVGVMLNHALHRPDLSWPAQAFLWLLGLAGYYVADLLWVRLAQPKSHHWLAGYEV